MSVFNVFFIIWQFQGVFEEHDLNVPTMLYDYDEIVSEVTDSAGIVIADALKQSPIKTQVTNQHNSTKFYFH